MIAYIIYTFLQHSVRNPLARQGTAQQKSNEKNTVGLRCYTQQRESEQAMSSLSHLFWPRNFVTNKHPSSLAGEYVVTTIVKE